LTIYWNGAVNSFISKCVGGAVIGYASRILTKDGTNLCKRPTLSVDTQREPITILLVYYIKFKVENIIASLSSMTQ
jgi:hypothetical protein